MAQLQDHFTQAKRNLIFLESINNTVPNCNDWQVTVCFYTALHLVNAHLSTHQLQYRRHNDVKDAINPMKVLSPSKLPDNEYIAYVTLQQLSRRSRYLVNEKDNNVDSEQASWTYEKHLGRALRHLDLLLSFFSIKYNISFPELTVKCAEISQKSELKVIRIKD